MRHTNSGPLQIRTEAKCDLQESAEEYKTYLQSNLQGLTLRRDEYYRCTDKESRSGEEETWMFMSSTLHPLLT